MTYSVLLLGATGTIGSKIASELAIHKAQLSRIAFLTPQADAGPEKEAKYRAAPIDRVVGSLDEPSSYQGFDIVISAVGDDLCAEQYKYIDAAFAGGVKHFYPAEYGADLMRPGTREERYFTAKIATRRHLEEKVAADPSKGYTYVMTGLFSDFMIQYNILFLSDDKRTANVTGTPDSRLSTTLSDDVAKLIVTSLLPNHLKTLAGPHEVRFAGSTLPIKDLYSAISAALGHDIIVNYGSKDESYVYEEEQKAAGNMFLWKFSSARRSIGFGGSELVDVNNEDYPEIKATPFEETVKEMLG